MCGLSWLPRWPRWWRASFGIRRYCSPKPWTILMGYDPNDKAKLAEMQKSAGLSYVMSLIASVLSAFVLGEIIAVAWVNTPLYGMRLGLAVWLESGPRVLLPTAFAAPQPVKLYLLNTGYQLVCYLVMGAIMGAWR